MVGLKFNPQTHKRKIIFARINIRVLTTNMSGTFLIKDCLAIEYGKGKRLGDKGEAETRL